MSAKKKSSVDPKSQLMLLFILVGIPACFIVFSILSDKLMSMAPVAMVGLLVVATAIYTAMTARMLYKYFGGSAPWYSYIPCFGETTIADSSCVKWSIPFYALAILFGVLTIVPANVFSFLPGTLEMRMPVYFVFAAVLMLVSVQIVKGIGIYNCCKFLDGECVDKLGTDIGILRVLSALAFVPFVRMVALYAVNTSLTKLVVFAERTISDTDSDELISDT